MQVTALKTKTIKTGDDLFEIISDSLQKYQSSDLENTILVVTSKVVSLAERNVVMDVDDKHQLVSQEADRYTEAESSKYGVMLTIKDSILAVNAGIDESNIGGGFVLLPKDSYASAEKIWRHVRTQFNLKNFGVVITDSTSFPLKWGVVGRALAYCGIEPLKDLRGTPDLYGRPLEMTQVNVVEGIASAAVLEMGEGNDSTPLCLVSEVKQATFQDHPPTAAERKALLIEVEDDVYFPILDSDKWHNNNR
jgi:F420-0:gamma-glutamyl ligase